MNEHNTKASPSASAERADRVVAPSTETTSGTAADAPATATRVIPFTSWRPGMSVVAALRHEKVFVKVPLVGQVDLPSGPHLVWFAGAIALAALEVVEWPVALLMMIGKALSDSERNEAVRSLGQVMESA